MSDILKDLTDTTKFSEEQIMMNLKDCLKGKKCCIFSCGANITEHCDKFQQIKNDKSFITCCIKYSIEYLQFEADILVLFGYINGTYLNNDKITNSFILKSELFEYNGISYDLDKFYLDNFASPTNYIIKFLNIIGIKEIYLFGFYLADYIINDLTNYNYYDDIVCEKFHTYDKPFSRTKEIEIFHEHIESIQITDYCINNNISIYNVSEFGCLSNKIKRINFESIFTNEKIFISSKIAYKDFLDEFDDKVDIDFYYERNCNNNNDINNKTFVDKKQEVLINLITEGVYCLKKVNKYDTKKEIVLNEFIKEIMSLVCYISYYPFPNLIAFFSHYLIIFNKVFNVCFYKDFDQICCPKFYDDLLLLYSNEINNIDFNIYYSEFYEKQFNENKYFKLFVYLYYLKDIPNDFIPKVYIELNKDLQHMTEAKAKIHYVYQGYTESRKYKYENIPDDFNAKEYIEINEDLKHMTELEAKFHYEYYGYTEIRKYKYENIPDN